MQKTSVLADGDRRCSKPAAQERDRENRRQRFIVFQPDPSDALFHIHRQY